VGSKRLRRKLLDCDCESYRGPYRRWPKSLCNPLPSCFSRPPGEKKILTTGDKQNRDCCRKHSAPSQCHAIHQNLVTYPETPELANTIIIIPYPLRERSLIVRGSSPCATCLVELPREQRNAHRVQILVRCFHPMRDPRETILRCDAFDVFNTHKTRQKKDLNIKY
jgi:hypothetical protein